ncbi:UvrD-helicase domain-containing protein [Wolbachia endosymbiont (group A) of Pogonocherus hispidulus]|uniref:UvrD-helicase domain-containing protein n=1 Tax=Wolbachia endosymbiont (group A) of Pogonocherus hispidulus TaxID=3066136 RepID=UPI00334172EA
MCPVFYYENFNEPGLGDNGNPLRRKFNTIVKDLSENKCTYQGSIKLIPSKGGIKYLRAKLSDKGRLLFTWVRYKNEDVFVMLEVIPDHDYKSSYFLSDAGKTKNIETKEMKVTKEGVVEKSSGTGSVKIKDLQQAHWLGKFITFSAKQEEIVENTGNLPLIVSGSAGSGKTSVALEKLRKIEEEFKKEEKCEGGEKKKILYITQSGSLVKESKKLYGYCDEAAGEIPQRVEFLSVHEFLEKVIREYVKEKIKECVEGRKPVNQKELLSWLESNTQKQSSENKKSTIQSTFLSLFRDVQEQFSKKDGKELISKNDFLSLFNNTQEQLNKVEGKKPINRNAFFSWFNEECKKGKFEKYAKEGDKIFEEFAAVIGGGGLLGEEGKNQYVNLRSRQAIFPQLERKKIYALFEEYKKFIEGSSEYYDTSLIAHECVEKVQANKVYDAVVVDEVQDLTESTLGLILKSLKDESNFLLCGDVNQVIHPSFFSVSRLKSFLRKGSGHELRVCTLEKNYRNSKQVIELANRILHLKNYCFASEDKMTADEKEAFFIKSDTENTGNVGFIAKDKEQEIAEKVPESVNWAVLVLDDESKEDARKLFKTPLVFNIQEAKGLEFENVILYKFTSHEAYNKVWNVACPGKKEIESTIDKIRDSYNTKDVNTSRPKNLS